jgi:hypothetical protein
MALAPISALGDLRRDRRGERILERMVERGSAQTHVLSRSRAEEVAFSRFFQNPHFTAAELRSSMRQAGLARCGGRAHVLVIQDTTEINYQHHVRRVRGLGLVGNGTDAGLFVHAVLALDAGERTCLGLLDAMPWIRAPRTNDYRRLPVEQKESRRWLDGLRLAAMAEAGLVTCMQDREGDMFEMFVRRPHERCHVLQRASRDRALADGTRLFAAMAALPASFGYAIGVPGGPERPGRKAWLVVRFGPLTLARPRRSREPTESVRIWALDVAEIASEAIPAEQRIHWRLLTTHAVEDAAMAAQVIDWYRQRWHIEQLFRILKAQGLDLEASQSEDAHALTKLAVMAAHAASRVTQLVQARDGHNKVAAGEVFEPEELEVMAALLPQLEGRTEKQKNPHPPDTLAWCAWIIARLGGWKGYRHSEGPPGPLTMQRGYEYFCILRDGYLLAQKNVCKP